LGSPGFNLPLGFDGKLNFSASNAVPLARQENSASSCCRTKMSGPPAKPLLDLKKQQMAVFLRIPEGEARTPHRFAQA
jgi:hypothetical protein